MFTGFTKETFDFLYGIYFNNERLWFNAHKEDYQRYLYEPLRDLSRSVFDLLMEQFPNRQLQCKVTRIYRDARLYRGISCYKENLWFSILGPCSSPSRSPSLWFEIRRNGWDYGMGLYHPSPATMARHRKQILQNPRRLDWLYQRLLGQSQFALRGESYAKFKPGAPAQLAAWFNFKSFHISYSTGDAALLYHGPQLVDRLVKGFTFLMPYFDYFYPLSDAAQSAENSQL